MRRHALVLTVLLSLGGSRVQAWAQGPGSVDGQVLDASRRPIVGARITLGPGGRSAQSDVDGTFAIRRLRPGTYSLDARRIGYRPAKVSVEVADRPVRVVITLIAIPQVLDSVLVAERGSGLLYSAVVVDDFGQPTPDAQVTALGAGDTTRTDVRGGFHVRASKPGTLMLRLRKLGYVPLLATVRLLGSRVDTLRMARIAQSLVPTEVLERSGFGRDTFVYRDLGARVRWMGQGAGVVSREELEQQGRVSLEESLPHTQTGALLQLKPGMRVASDCILLNGERPSIWPLRAIFADQVEAVE